MCVRSVYRLREPRALRTWFNFLLLLLYLSSSPALPSDGRTCFIEYCYTPPPNQQHPSSILPSDFFVCSKNVKFRRVAAVSLAALLDAFPECCVYDMVAPTLLDFAALDGPRPDGKEDPIMQARAVACLAAAWPRAPPPAAALSAAAGGGKKEGSSQAKIKTTAAATIAMKNEVAFARREAVRNVQRAHAEGLTRALSGAVQRKVWSVRVPIYHALAAVVGRSYTVPSSVVGGGGDGQGAASSPPVLTGSLLSDVVHAVELGAEDAKYSQVRLRNSFPSRPDNLVDCALCVAAATRSRCT